MLTRGTYDDHRYHINFERPGEFKKHDYVTGKYEVGSAPEQVEKNLRDLLSELDEYEGEDHLQRASIFMRFLKISIRSPMAMDESAEH